jgi:hypothetical protein
MKESETLQQALSQYQKPNLKFFETVKVPQYVARPSDAGAYGASNLTPQGIQNAPLVPQKPLGGEKKQKGPVVSYGPGEEPLPIAAAAR